MWVRTMTVCVAGALCLAKSNAAAQNLAPNPDFSGNAALFTYSPGYTKGAWAGNTQGGANTNPNDISNWYSFNAWHGVNGGSAPFNVFGPADQTGVSYYAFKHGGGAAARLFSDPFSLSPNTAYRLSFKCASGAGQTTGDLTNSVFINYWNYGIGNRDLALLTFTAPRLSFASYSYDFTTGSDANGGPRILWDTDSSTTLGNAAALAQVSLTAIGAAQKALDFDAPSGSSTVGTSLSGTGGVTKAGVSTLVLSGANTYSGATTLNRGRIMLGASGAIGDSSAVVISDDADGGYQTRLVLNGYNETIAGLSSGGLGNDRFVEAAADDVSNKPATLTIRSEGTSIYHGWFRDAPGTATNSALSLTKTGTGTQVLNGGNTFVNYSGATIVSNGVLEFGNSTVANKSVITVNSNAFVRFDTPVDVTRTNVITGEGGLVKTGSGKLTLTGSSGQVNYKGSTVVTAGTLTYAGGYATVNSSPMFMTNATVEFANGGTRTCPIAGTGGNVLISSPTTLLQLGGIHTYTGDLIIDSPVVWSWNNLAVSPQSGIALKSGLYDMNGANLTVARLSGSTGVASNGTITVTQTTSPGGTSGIGCVMMKGTLNLSGEYEVNVNATTNDTLLVEGTLTLSSLSLDVTGLTAAGTMTHYLILETLNGTVQGGFDSDNLPSGWKVVILNQSRVEIRKVTGTLVRLF